MQFFRGWVLIICLSIIGVSILEMITLNEKMNKARIINMSTIFIIIFVFSM